MRIFYTIYAAIVVGLMGLNVGDSVMINLVQCGWMALWAAGAILMNLRARRFRWVALVPLVPLIGLLLVQSGRSVAFILEHRGLDCATCNASPIAFVLHWGIEIILLVPGALLCILLVRRLRRDGAAR
jgi:hypothetical protein